MKADYVETCNCDFGCPCNFNGFPTYGFCRTLVLYHIQSASFGDVKLDGLEVIVPESWPKAIHEGNGTFQLFVTKTADQSQRQALVSIFSIKAKGDGPFTLFACTFKYVLDPQFVDIKAKVAGRKVVSQEKVFCTAIGSVLEKAEKERERELEITTHMKETTTVLETKIKHKKTSAFSQAYRLFSEGKDGFTLLLLSRNLCKI